MLFTDSEDVEPGYLVILAIALAAMLPAVITGILVRGIVYFFHRSFSITDDATILCLALAGCVWVGFFVFLAVDSRSPKN